MFFLNTRGIWESISYLLSILSQFYDIFIVILVLRNDSDIVQLEFSYLCILNSVSLCSEPGIFL